MSERSIDTDIAIISMSGRFPGAHNIEEFWQNLLNGVESVTSFTDEELLAAGVDPKLLNDPNYVKAGAVLKDVDLFDASFFGFTPREAQIMDPQQRLFLETAWNTLESAGYDPETYAGSIGLYGGTGLSTYLLNNLHGNPEVSDAVSTLQLVIGNDKDALTTRVAYLLNLTGPCYTVQTFCSTSLVSICVACSSLLAGECDMAMAGGVVIAIPQAAGYLYEEGGVASPDARCRAFDAQANGSPLGNGVGVVLLKRLADALEDGDTIHAVIKGWAINNDGSAKVGYTAPGVRGQSQVIMEALANAEVSAESIQYIEAHGTGTVLGDAVELTSLIKAFQEQTTRQGFCALGSAKTNVGHLDRAAGVTGIIKTVLSLEHGLIPPSLNYTTPNTQVDLAESPFFVNTHVREWKRLAEPRRAGVSAFGIGGTNAHVVLEEAPELPPSGPSRPHQLLLLSAKTASALHQACANLHDHLQRHPELPLPDVAYTLQVGRKAFPYRRALLASSLPQALSSLTADDPARPPVAGERPVAFLFSGVGEHAPGMARDLYQHEPVFRQVVDQCAQLLLPLLDVDLRELLWPSSSTASTQPGIDLRAMLGQRGAPTSLLARTRYAQPAVFVLDYALAHLLLSWGIRPQSLLGYSLGEYVAACLAGVFSLSDALTLIARRAALIDQLPSGAMLAVSLSDQQVQPYLGPELTLAITTGPAMCVVAGPEAAIAALEHRCEAQEIVVRRLQTTHAFHSPLLAPARQPLAEVLAGIPLSAPQIPYLSNLTGTWITAEQATSQQYWLEQMCEPVRFSEALSVLAHSEPAPVLLEVGPGQALTSIAKMHPASRSREVLVLPTMRTHYQQQDDQALLLQTLGQLWQAGVVVDWAAFTQQEERRRVPLPTYPFERQRYWIDPPHKTAMVTAATAASEKKRAIGDWFYAPSWERAPLAPHQPSSTLEPCLFFLDESRITEQLAQRIEQLRPVIRVHVARTYQKYDEKHYALPIADDEGYRRLFENLKHDRLLPTQIIHAWSMTSTTSSAQDRLGFEQQQRSGLYSLLALTRALMAVESIDTVTLTVLTNHLYAVTGQEELYPEQATLIGACKVIAQEYPGLQTCCLDLDDNAMGLLDPLIVELTRGFQDREVAYRGNQRWVPRFTLRHLDPPTQPCFREHGVYLLTGGLGGVGLKLAEAIARQVHATIVLLGRHGLPERAHWEQWITEHGSADATSTRIRAVQDLERLGAEVNVVACDVADLEQLRHVVTSLDTQYGRLDGVIHCAGYTTREAFQYIQHVQVEDCQRHFQSKVYGLYALEQVLQGRDLDFCMVFSSLSAVLGGLGFFAYASANAFVDAFVTRHNQHASQHWVCVDWDTWQVSSIETSGMSMSGTVAGYSMTPQEGVEAFQRILASQAEHLIQSTGDLQTRIRQWVYLEEATPTTTDSASSNTSPSPVLRQTALATPADNLEQRLADIWGRVLGLAQVSLTDNFFDMGGNSLIGLQVISKIRKELHVQISNVALFEAPTIQAMARYLRPKPEIEPSSELNVLQQRRRRAQQKTGVSEIAIVGMSGRFPGANTIEQFWENLCAGKESISFFSDEELLAAGLDPELIAQPHYVKARPILDDVAGFDAAFFGYSPREAELMDPQHRLFLEGCWEALEHAGYDPHAYAGLIGVFGGSNISTYLLQILQRPDVAQDMNIYQMVISNDKDSLTTTVSYKLNLKGPSYGVQTFCSTSLVAIHLAGQSLLNGECDMALAGGVSVRVPPVAGHLYEEGGMESPDGHCRTFDADARGGMFGDGVGLVVLKRLEDALQDGDTVYAVIKGSAINNDGSLKVSYTAPSVVGQTEVVSMALETAAVHPESIQYLEAHGTATELGDPIEVTSLTKAFRLQTQKKQYCAIGSVKTNVGHLDRAAGVSGLIKIVMGLRHQQIPASLHYHTPNPAIDFENSPFYVNTALAPWEPNLNGLPRRAGLNSLGMGGTNAHVVLEEAPELPPSGPSRPHQLLLLSAKTASALQQASANLHDHLQRHPELPLPDVAYTLQVGRKAFPYRRALLASSLPQALSSLTASDPARPPVVGERPVAFLFSGVGEHAPGMARDLYLHEPVFRQVVDQCAQLLLPLLDADLRELLWPPSSTSPTQPGIDLRAMLGQRGAPTSPLARTRYAQPAVFVLDYALAHLLLSWGIRPQSLLGYSLGEYVAACLAGVFSLPDALTLVARRAALIDQLPSGAMLAVSLSDQQVQPYLGPELTLAITTGPAMCVVAGPEAAIAALEHRCEAQEIVVRRLQTTHAFHSPLLAPARQPLAEVLAGIPLSAPQIPYLSNLTGTWITAEQATSQQYWLEQMCEPVRFSEALSVLAHSEPAPVLLEVGPGQALTSIAKMHPASRSREVLVLPTMRTHYQQQDDQALLLQTLGQLWQAGVVVDWAAFTQQEERRRVPLPTYPFEHQRYWIDPPKQSTQPFQSGATPQNFASFEEGIKHLRKEQLDNWFYLPAWKRVVPRQSFTADLQQTHTWIVLADEYGVAERLQQRLHDYGQDVVLVRPGAQFERLSAVSYTLQPRARADYAALFLSLHKEGKIPDRIVHLWTLAPATDLPLPEDSAQLLLDRGFHSLLALTQALGDSNLASCQISVLTNELYNVTGSERLCPEKATVIGPCRVIPIEYPHISCRNIDITLPEPGSLEQERLLDLLLGELSASPDEVITALRGSHRWLQTYEPVQINGDVPTARLRPGGVYLITGGLGGVGLGIAAYLARTVQARLVLLARSALPPREQWEEILSREDLSQGIGYKLRTMLEIEQLGSQVEVVTADVAHEEEMRTAIQRTIDCFGTLHGVIHAAGVPGIGLMQMKTPEQADKVLSPKVAGTRVLEKVLQPFTLDFLVLCSSITSFMGGGPGQADYCAANAYLDAFALSRDTQKRRVLAINWGEWQWNAWEAGLEGYDKDTQAFFRANRQRFGISFEDGTEALRRLLSTAFSQVIVSPQDFRTFAELAKSFTASSILKNAQEKQREKYPRPTLSNPYTAPRSELERTITAIWEELLGISGIGTEDNFFELGGNSLIGLDAITRLRKALHLETLPAYVLYEAPSVCTMAQHLEQSHQSEEITDRHGRGEKRRASLKNRMHEIRRAM